jgi:hypothetical protein
MQGGLRWKIFGNLLNTFCKSIGAMRFHSSAPAKCLKIFSIFKDNLICLTSTHFYFNVIETNIQSFLAHSSSYGFPPIL